MTFAIAFAVYTIAIVAVGVYSARYARRSDEDYFLAGRSLGPWVAALSASASSESGWVTLGLVGWAFKNGMTAYWIIPGCLLGFLFNWFVIAARMRDRSAALSALTLPDFFAFNFRERVPIVRILSVTVILVAMVLYVAAQFGAAGKAFNAAFSNVDYQAGVIIGAAIVLAYTVLGGFRAACWTDFLQSLIMVGTLVMFPAYLLFSSGGYGEIATHLESEDPALLRFTPEATASAFIGFLLGHGALGINFGYPGQPHVLVRFMALRDRKEAVIGGFVSAVWAILIYWGAVTVGLIVRAKAAQGEGWAEALTVELAGGDDGAGDPGLVLAAKNLIPFGILSGMVLAAVLAAICSTADSQLVVATSAAANDLYTRMVEKSKRTAHLLINRAVLIALCVIAVLLVIGTNIPIFDFVLTHGWAILGASFGPQVALILLWRRASYVGCIAGMSTGFGLAIIWPLVYDEVATGVHIYNLPVAFVAALIVNVVFSMAFPERRYEGPRTPETGA